VSQTIDIILRNVYHNDEMAPPDIPADELKKLLTICTTKTPFRDPYGNMYVQCEGVSMGSALGPTFAEFYMCDLENRAFAENPAIKPIIYARYVDDCFLFVRNTQGLAAVRDLFVSNSVLNFTFEMEVSNKLSFLDVLINRQIRNFETTVHVKSTHSGDCINFRSICPNRYKIGVVKTLLHRAYHICSNWQNFHLEVERIKQLLTNNNFPMHIIDDSIDKFLNKAMQCPSNDQQEQNINLFYESQMTSQYRSEEKRIKSIISDNIKPAIDGTNVKLIIYYRNRKLKDLIIKNRPHTNSELADRHGVVYQYYCSNVGCHPFQSYIGYTTCTLSDRFRMHAVNGSIKKHLVECHNYSRVTKAELLNSIKILRSCTTKQELIMTEAVLIKQERPTLNSQDEGAERILKIFKH